MTTETHACRIWGKDYPASGYIRPEPSQVVIEDSPRAGGGYIALGDTKPWFELINDEERARLTSWLVDQRRLGDAQPTITSEIIRYAKNSRQLPIHERANRLLRYFETHSEFAGARVRIGFEGEYNEHGEWVAHPSHSTWRAMAWSESTDWREVSYCVDYLERMGWITATRQANQHLMAEVMVTIEGYSHVADLDTNHDSSQAFIAMWFDESMKEAYEKGIEPGIEDAGFKCLRIDRKDHINRIEDEIIGEIRRSRFIVADFTQGDDGARGGVYYEAGFAHGIGLPVIYTCHTRCEKQLHFDTSHINHIFWTTPEELHEKLRNRVLAVIGEGPTRHGRE